MSDKLKMFEALPSAPPATPLLDSVALPQDLRQLNEQQLPQLADELREFLLYSVGQTGGHFGAGLGVVELTVALHYLYNTPYDRLVWDVGHQTYPHKILTGRRANMSTMRQAGGLSAFTKRAESEYDTFGVGHSSTSISAALGMALAAAQEESERKVVAVIGDGAMTAGMAFEALNHAAHTRANMLVILNDNQMSISHNQGGLANYFAKIWASKLYTSMREGSKKVLAKIPSAWELARRTEEHMKGMVAPGTLFEELGFNYIGPIDGHDLDSLVHTITNMRELEGPQLLHITTCKGRGFVPAENDPVGYHAINKIDPAPKSSNGKKTPPRPKYQQVFGDWLCDMAALDNKLIGITPAMCEGSGMVEFARRFADRYHDVAIAEQHAVTLAAGMACEKMKPVVAIYSTFLQRAYDQLIHDVALQNLDVLFAIDRAGLVGEDGPTHAGSFDLSYLRCVPNMVVMAPSDENET
ncbi:MAG: 1-deoxy-D-xylulose-5-phosphate synthase, partial [Pseudomonadales bacterium]